MNYVLVIKRICTAPDDEGLAHVENAGNSIAEALFAGTEAAHVLARKGWEVWRDQDGWWAIKDDVTLDLYVRPLEYTN